jgi:hypothetical protein
LLSIAIVTTATAESIPMLLVAGIQKRRFCHEAFHCRRRLSVISHVIDRIRD